MALGLALFGSDFVGKTQLCDRFLHGEFSNDVRSLIAPLSVVGNTYCSGRNIKVYTWILNSRKAFLELSITYLKICKGIMLVYSVNDERTFSLIPTIIEHVPKDKVMILVGNKCDSDKRKITKEEGKEMARMYNLKFFETSAKEKINVHEAFVTLLEDTFQELDFHVEPEAKAVAMDEGHKNEDKKVSIFQRFMGLFHRSHVPANNTTEGDNPSVLSTKIEVNSSIIEKGTLENPGPSSQGNIQDDIVEPEPVDLKHVVSRVTEDEVFSQGTILDDVNNSNDRYLKPGVSNVHEPGPLVCGPGPSVKQQEVHEPEDLSFHTSHGVEAVNENDESQRKSIDNNSELAIEPESVFFAARNILEKDQVPIEHTDTSEYHYEL